MNEKKLTAQALKAQQEAREKAAKETADKQRDEAIAKRQAAYDAEQAKLVGAIANTWHDQACRASEHTGCSFCVLARVVSGMTPPLNAIVNEARELGFTMTLAPMIRGSEEAAVHVRAIQHNDQFVTGGPKEPCEAFDGQSKGFCHGPLPQIGQSGTVGFLVVRW
jgi:hypothetical protein